ncbi:MAG TPA: hypothetical protein PLF15_00530 [bacterium]|nr:hypothetical protein [bacterium]
MFDNNSNINSKPASLPDYNQDKPYPFRKVEEKKISGLKGPIEDILSGTDSSGSPQLADYNNQPREINLKEPPQVPAMQNKTIMNNTLSTSINHETGPSIKPPSKGKTGIIILIIILVLILIGAGVLAYIYFTNKNKTTETTDNSNLNSSQQTQINNNLKDLLDVINSNVPEETVPQNTTTISEPPVDLIFTSDEDDDGLTDEQELELGTDPEKGDSDSDGLTDQEELEIYHTSPVNSDSDDDSYLDGAEIKNGYNPLGPGKLIP